MGLFDFLKPKPNKNRIVHPGTETKKQRPADEEAIAEALENPVLEEAIRNLPSAKGKIKVQKYRPDPSAYRAVYGEKRLTAGDLPMKPSAPPQKGK